jgi:hypothetical protein
MKFKVGDRAAPKNRRRHPRVVIEECWGRQ